MSDGQQQQRRGGLAPEDLFSVRGKQCLVTGGATGIGLMVASGLVQGGATVVISSRKAAACEAAAAALNRRGPGKAYAVAADVSREEDCQRLRDEVARLCGGRLDVLVNNAGTNYAAPVEQYPGKAFDKVYGVNVRGVFVLTRCLLPLLEAAQKPAGAGAGAGAALADPARVINVGSIDGLSVPGMETYAYSSSKAAVHHLTRAMAVHLAPRGVTVNAVAPGPFRSKMMKVTLERAEQAIVSGCPLGRIGEPEDMAGVVLYLASRAAAYVTGVVIPVDGGIRIASRM